MPDDVGVTDAVLVETVAREICRRAISTDNHWRSWKGEAEAAIAALQPDLDARYQDGLFAGMAMLHQGNEALSAAREAGRREGLEQAAQSAEQVHSQYYLGGNLVQIRQWDDGPAISRAIRALIPAASAPMEVEHG